MSTPHLHLMQGDSGLSGIYQQLTPFIRPITHQPASLEVVTLQGHYETLQFGFIQAPHFPIFLGVPWLTIHELCIHWWAGVILFGSPHCQQFCLLKLDCGDYRLGALYGSACLP